MILTVKPASHLKGKVQLPSSKSFSIRAFMIASCGGDSMIVNPSDCDDAKVSMRVAKLLGARIRRFKKHFWNVEPRRTVALPSIINVKESGTVLRFLLPLVMLRGKRITVTGEGTLRGRPNSLLTQTLRHMGVMIKGQGKTESIPLRITGGELCGGRIEIDGTLSSQFISALLITCPQLKQDSRLILKGKRLVSEDYITMTLQVLQKSGIKITKKGHRTYLIKGGQKFQGLKKFVIPADYGLAAFLMGAAVLIPSNVTLAGDFNDRLIQADGQILHLLNRMGVKISRTAKAIRIHGPFSLIGGDFSLKDCPDLVPIMAVLALFAKNKTRLYNIRHAKVKEADRISDLRTELLKVGANVSEKINELIIHPKHNYKNNCILDPHRDHRLAMAFCVLGLKLGVRVKDIDCVSKSYPEFVRDLKSIGARMRRA